MDPLTQRQFPGLSTIEGILQKAHPQRLPDGMDFEETVVFLLLFDAKNPHLLAILKSDTEGYPWRNQVALPGGHIEEGDDTALEAAFRELKEEVHIHREEVRTIGSLGHFQTINNKNIEVFLGIWDERRKVCYDRAEIARVLRIPLAELYRIHMEHGFHGRLPDVHELVYPFGGVQIWGVTGKILHYLMELLRSAFAKEDPQGVEQESVSRSGS